MLPLCAVASAQEPPGSIRGVVQDKEFDTPLAAAQVLVVETKQKTLTGDQGNYVFGQVAPGTYTLVFTKDGYLRQVKAGVVVSSGKLTDVDVQLQGEFTDMDEFVVQDMLQFGAGSEAALLKMRFESAALMDSIGSDLMSRAGAGDAASGLRLVSGVSVQGGKFAVIRGLPDRYVSSQLNFVRLPSADENKRAIELDQFPAAVIESLQVAKTFTPDQQGDASGGAVNLRTKGIPEETKFELKAQYTYNTQSTGRSDFLTYKGGGFDAFGGDDGHDLQPVGTSWSGAVGTSRDDAPANYKLALSGGGRTDIGGGTKIGGFASAFYERESLFYDNGKNDSWWVTHPGDPMTPQTNQGTPEGGEFKTALYDVTQGRQQLRWGGIGTLGLETDGGGLTFTGLFTKVTTDTATLATDTRGKEYFFPGYDPHDPTGPGNTPTTRAAAPYLRLETLDLTERTTSTLQLSGHHDLPWGPFALTDAFEVKGPRLDWTIAHSTAEKDQPDKRQFSAEWQPRSYNPGAPPFLPPFYTAPVWTPYLPSANFNLGNVQRTWKDIREESDQLALNLEFPFEQWQGEKGWLKVGGFYDDLKREYSQETFSNFGQSGDSFQGDWNDPWSAHFPDQDHPITASETDDNYDGGQKQSALFSMLDLPLSSTLTLIGGVRFETVQVDVVNHPESDTFWFPPGATAPVQLNPGDADVAISRSDALPSIGLVFTPVKQLSLHASYSETVAHQTFKELTPIIQQEFLGGPTFIGNPELQMSSLKNYDLRADWVPSEGSLVSASWFKKDITDPIEYVQRLVEFTYTTPVNYPKGELDGWEFEVRDSLEHLWKPLMGVSVGANATFIDSQVTLPESEAAGFSEPGIMAPMTSRDMTGAPDHIYNVYLTWDSPEKTTQMSLFYTVQGDTLLEGAGESLGNFVPSIYAKEYDTLFLSLSHEFAKGVRLTVQGKNLTNPRIEEVYRSPYIGGDVTKTSYTKGIEYTLGLSVSF